MRGGQLVAQAETRAAQVPAWALARSYTRKAIERLAYLMEHADSEPVQASCAQALLDRAWGKAPIIVAGDEDRPIQVDMRTIGPEHLAHLELALKQALGEQIAQAIQREPKLLPPDAQGAGDSVGSHVESGGEGDTNGSDNANDSNGLAGAEG